MNDLGLCTWEEFVIILLIPMLVSILELCCSHLVGGLRFGCYCCYLGPLLSIVQLRLKNGG